MSNTKQTYKICQRLLNFAKSGNACILTSGPLELWQTVLRARCNELDVSIVVTKY